MMSYCLKCKKDIESKEFQILAMVKKMLLLKCAKCGSKKSRLIKNQEAKGLLSNLGIRTPLSKVPVLGDILFQKYKMNEIVNKFLLAGNKFMPEIHLKQPGFTYTACGLFTENKEKIQKFKETGDTNYVYKNKALIRLL